MAEYNSPGPASYNLPSTIGYKNHDPSKGRLPAWQFGTKHRHSSKDSSPGPVHYPPANHTRYGRDGTPSFTQKSRPRTPKSFKPPGPGTYSPERSGPSASPRAPSFSLGHRTKLRREDSNPAPNNYSLPTLLGRSFEGDKYQAPSYSLYGRSKTGGFDEDLQKTPGPGTYPTTDPNSYKHRDPLFSLTSRHVPPGDATKKPGPGAHSPEKVVIDKAIAPSFSFGVHHSPYTAPIIFNDVEG